MTGTDRQTAGFGISWSWPGAARGAVCALPGGLVVLADAPLGMCLALGSLLVAMLPLPASRARRPKLALASVAFGLAYCAGALLGLAPAGVEVVVLAAVAYAGVVASTRIQAAALLPALALPAFALGLNHPAPDGLVYAGVLLLGAGWAVAALYAWPEHDSADAVPRPEPAASPMPTHVYAALFAAAAGTALALAYQLDFAHVAWAAAAAMFIMRPDPHLLASRAVGRAAATFAGVTAAGLVLREGPSELVLAVLTVVAVSGVVAAARSRWYVTSAATGLLVLLMSGAIGRHAFDVSFWERLVETALGAGLALLFGVAIPTLLRRSE